MTDPRSNAWVRQLVLRLKGDEPGLCLLHALLSLLDPRLCVHIPPPPGGDHDLDTAPRWAEPPVSGPIEPWTTDGATTALERRGVARMQKQRPKR